MTRITEIFTTQNQAQCIAGSGLPKIQQGWQGHSLTIYDSLKPYDQTITELTWGTLEKTTQETTQKTTHKLTEKQLGGWNQIQP